MTEAHRSADTLVARLRSEALARGAELDFDGEGAEVVAADHLCMLAAIEIERLRDALEKVADFDCRYEEHVGEMKCWSCYAKDALAGST